MRPHAREAGFTLVEVMVALMIVATTVAALQTVSGATMRAALETNHVRVAKMLLRAKAEEVASGVETSAGGSFDDLGFHGYTWVANEQLLQAAEEETVRSVEVTIRYPTRTSSNADSFFAGGDMVGQTGDTPGMVRLTVYLDPADAKLEPPQQ